LPVADPGRLVQLRIVTPGEPRMAQSFPYSIFRELSKRAEVFSGLFAVADGPQFVELDGRSEEGRSVYSSGAFFSTLGIGAVAGRTLTPEDDQPAAPGAIAIGHRFWERRFARDPAALGRSVTIEGVSCTIVGVLPPGFLGVDVGTSPD